MWSIVKLAGNADRTWRSRKQPGRGWDLMQFFQMQNCISSHTPEFNLRFFFKSAVNLLPQFPCVSPPLALHCSTVIHMAYSAKSNSQNKSNKSHSTIDYLLYSLHFFDCLIKKVFDCYFKSTVGVLKGTKVKSSIWFIHNTFSQPKSHLIFN